MFFLAVPWYWAAWSLWMRPTEWDLQARDGTHSFPACQQQTAAVGFRDAVGEGQTQATSPGLGRVELVERVLATPGIHSSPGVLDGDDEPIILPSASGSDREPASV